MKLLNFLRDFVRHPATRPGTQQQLLELARCIANSVQARFGVAIEPEPRIIGAAWAP